MCSERLPIVPFSLIHRLSYAIYYWLFRLFTVFCIDLKCNEQNHTKMSQQSHSVCFTSSSEVVLTENIFQKLSLIDTPRNYSGQVGTLGDIQHCWSDEVIKLHDAHIAVMQLWLLFIFTFILVIAWMGGKLYRMEETENTDNFRNYLVPI